MVCSTKQLLQAAAAICSQGWLLRQSETSAEELDGHLDAASRRSGLHREMRRAQRVNDSWGSGHRQFSIVFDLRRACWMASQGELGLPSEQLGRTSTARLLLVIARRGKWWLPLALATTREWASIGCSRLSGPGVCKTDPSQRSVRGRSRCSLPAASLALHLKPTQTTSWRDGARCRRYTYPPAPSCLVLLAIVVAATPHSWTAGLLGARRARRARPILKPIDRHECGLRAPCTRHRRAIDCSRTAWPARGFGASCAP